MSLRKIPRVFFEQCQNSESKVNIYLENILGYIARKDKPELVQEKVTIDLNSYAEVNIEESILEEIAIKFNCNDNQCISFILGITLVFGGRE